MSDFTHGTLTGYTNRRCRCGDCRGAFAAYRRARRAKLRHAPAKQIPHGTLNGYTNYACRCYPCYQANAAYGREYYARHR